MRVYTVHLRDYGLAPDKDIVLVREGFSWMAFLFTFVWALWHRMWWVALGLFVIVVGTGLAAERLFGEGPAAFAVTLVVSAVIGFVADDVRRRHLAAQGFADEGVVAAPDDEQALHRYLTGVPGLAADMRAAP